MKVHFSLFYRMGRTHIVTDLTANVTHFEIYIRTTQDFKRTQNGSKLEKLFAEIGSVGIDVRASNSYGGVNDM